jgi:hypothetical protein
MVPDRLTPRRVLWLACACLLLVPAFASAAPARAGDSHLFARRVHAAHHFDLDYTAGRVPVRRTVDDNDTESDDLIGDSWLAPSALDSDGFVEPAIPERPVAHRSRPVPRYRSLIAIDPFAPRPPPARFLL